MPSGFAARGPTAKLNTIKDMARHLLAPYKQIGHIRCV